MSDETSPVSDGEPGTSLGLRISLSSGGKARSLPPGARLRRGTAAARAARRLPCAGAAAAGRREVERIVSAAASMDKKRGYFPAVLPTAKPSKLGVVFERFGQRIVRAGSSPLLDNEFCLLASAPWLAASGVAAGPATTAFFWKKKYAGPAWPIYAGRGSALGPSPDRAANGGLLLHRDQIIRPSN